MGISSEHQVVPGTPSLINPQGDDDRAETRGHENLTNLTEVTGRPIPGRQRPITDRALSAGLEALSRALARHHPGRRFIFEAAPRDDRAGLVDGGEIVGRLALPKDPDAALVDRDRLWAGGPPTFRTNTQPIIARSTAARSRRGRPRYASTVNPESCGNSCDARSAATRRSVSSTTSTSGSTNDSQTAPSRRRAETSRRIASRSSRAAADSASASVRASESATPM
jgi:hypothetical protein